MKVKITLSIIVSFLICGHVFAQVSVPPSYPPVKSTVPEASHVLKASPGQLIALRVFYGGATAAYLMVFDSPTVPADGAIVTSGSGSLLEPPIYLPGTCNVYTGYQSAPVIASYGISACISTTSIVTGTARLTSGTNNALFQSLVK